MSHTHHELITGPGVWIGRDIQDDASWIHHLDADAIAEIDAALAWVKRAGTRSPYSADAFPLPRLRAKLDAILQEVEDGRGFVLIRGIPRSRYSDDECELLYWGLTSHFGTPVSQNARGHLLGHVRDEGRVHSDPNARLYQTRERMDFHTDMLPVDVLGLFCMRAAKAGGESAYYESAARFGAAYAPTALQLEALETVQEIANRPALMLSMDFQEGDIQLLNNHTTLHARTAFEDFDEPGRQRHLLRMWIAVPDRHRRPLADSLAERYRWVQRGGIPVKADS